MLLSPSPTVSTVNVCQQSLLTAENVHFSMVPSAFQPLCQRCQRKLLYLQQMACAVLLLSLSLFFCFLYGFLVDIVDSSSESLIFQRIRCQRTCQQTVNVVNELRTARPHSSARSHPACSQSSCMPFAVRTLQTAAVLPVPIR